MEYQGCNKCKYEKTDRYSYPCSFCVHNAEEHFQPKTNADRIRNMTDEELAEWLHNICQFENSDHFPMISIYNLDTKCEEEIGDNYKDLIEWLQAEVKESDSNAC